MTVTEAADYLRISRRQVFYLIERGLPTVRLGTKTVRLCTNDVDRWVRESHTMPLSSERDSVG